MADHTQLVPYLQADQRTRWQRGDAILVEAYLEQYPSLRENQDAVVVLI
jgi:hypothetical protein